MNYKKYAIMLCLLTINMLFSQVGIGTTTPNAQLDVLSSNEGMLIPRIALVNTTTATVLTPTVSEIVYNTSTINDVTPGYYYWSGANWIRFNTGSSGSGSGWLLTGNTVTGTDYIGTNSWHSFKQYAGGTKFGEIQPGGSVFFGVSATGNASNAFVFGPRAQANSSESFAFGPDVISDGWHSIGIGESAHPRATNSIAIGRGANSTAGGSDSMSIGANATTSANAAFAIGRSAQSSSDDSFAVGYDARASASQSFSLGASSRASGTGSLALGNSANASGLYSTALGYQATTSQPNAIVLGNSSDVSSKVGIGTNTPNSKLHVSDGTSPNTATVQVSGLSSTSTLTTNATDAMVMVDNNGIMRRSNETVKDAWYTSGNATTALRSIGTTTNQPFQFIANNIARGRVNATDGEFVWGGATASPYAGDALCAVANATTTFALNGYSSFNGSGTWGEIMAASTTAFSAVQGVYGGSGAGAGVLGNYNGTNTSNTRSGVSGICSTPAAANGGTGVYGYNAIASGSQRMGVLGQYNSAAFGLGVVGIGFGGGIMTGNNDVAVVGWRGNNANYSGYFNGNHVIANGTKSASVGTSKGNQLLYVTEAPEVWFEDIGRGKLVNGIVEIKLDPLFLETVFIDEKHPMSVFLQEEGDSKGLYVIPGKDGFVVKEKNGGTSSISFSYRIMAKRLHFQDHRFGNDPVWGEGDTRTYNQYATPPPVDYNENVRFQENQRKNYKPTPMPKGFITYETLQEEAKKVELTKPQKK
jgi:hypothetical protein